ncbi:MAG TPA: HesA/MoeB/ThiF family protein [Coriobacteriia bacterium]
MNLTDEQIARYSRQIIVPEVGAAGQERLLASSVLVVGAGGLGSPALLYLAAAGVGRIGIVDGDSVDVTNLQRQIAHRTADIDANKAASAREKLLAIDPALDVITYEYSLIAANALETFAGWGLVLDGSDNFATRYLVNDACVLLDTPLVSAAILRFAGQLTTVVPHDGPCYRCIYPEQPPAGSVPSCSQAGILGPVAGVLGALQAVEAIKVLLGRGEILKGRLLVVDTLGMRTQEVAVERRRDCARCGEHPAMSELTDGEETCSAR